MTIIHMLTATSALLVRLACLECCRFNDTADLQLPLPAQGIWTSALTGSAFEDYPLRHRNDNLFQAMPCSSMPY